MARAKSNDYFSPGDSNTIDDITGFKTKMSKVRRRWEGWYTNQGWHPRQPQDFPITPTPQEVVRQVRTEQVIAEDAVTPIAPGDII